MLTLLAISGSTLFSVILWLVIAAVIFWLVTWAINYIGIPEPFAKVIKVILVIIVAIFLINVLLTIAGKPFIVW